MRTLRFLCCPILILTGPAVSASATQPETIRLDVDGAHRQAIICAPSAASESHGAPLVFVFHGHGGSMQNVARAMQIQAIWPEAVVVYPQGLATPTRVDPKGKRLGWQLALGEEGDRDLKFFDALLAAVNKKYTIEPRHIYATGFSNGAVFTYVLWAARPKIVAAVAPIAGLPLPGVRMKVAKPAFVVAGEADPLVKIENQRAMIEEICKLNHDSDTPVETIIHRGGHIIPANAPKMIVDFFRAPDLNR
jgi:polyhydroxybutyrate depolymerase